MKSIYLFTDMDRTIIDNGPQNESPHAASLFYRFCHHPSVTVTYVSGRHLSLINDAIDQYDLPKPDYIVADVGTRIYHLESQIWVGDETWDNQLNIGWDFRSLWDIAVGFIKQNDWRLQEDDKQSNVKISFYAPIDDEQGVDELEKLLAGFAHRLIYSIDVEKNVALVDLLPARADKKTAIEFLIQNTNMDMSRVIYAGDSGNDASVLVSPIRGVVVANAEAKFKTQMIAQASSMGNENFIYIAQGDFLQMNGCYRGGLLEGIAYYFPEWLDIFQQWITSRD